MCHFFSRLVGRAPFEELTQLRILTHAPSRVRNEETIRMELSSDRLVIQPECDEFSNTESIMSYDSNTIRLLKGSSGIETRRNKVETKVEEILRDFETAKRKRVIFLPPKANSQNQAELFLAVAGAIINSDERDRYEHLREVFVDWPEVKDRMRELYSLKEKDISVLQRAGSSMLPP